MAKDAFQVVLLASLFCCLFAVPFRPRCYEPCGLVCPYGPADHRFGCPVCACKPAPDGPFIIEPSRPRCNEPCGLVCRYGVERDPISGCALCSCQPAPGWPWPFITG